MLFSIVVFLPIILFLIHHLLFKEGRKSLPPGPTLWQLWRKRYIFAKKPHLALKELAQIYGPLFSIRIGGQLIVVASSPATAEEILKTNKLIFSGRYIPSVYYNAPGTENASVALAREPDASWKLLRNTLQNSIFSSKALESAAAIRKAKVSEMLQLLREEKAVNLEHAVHAAIVNIIMNVLSSRDMYENGGVGLKDERTMQFLEEVVDLSSNFGLADVFPFLRGVDFWSRGGSMEIYQMKKVMWGDVIKERRKNDSDGRLDSERDFLDVLNGFSYDDDQLATILMELLMAGLDGPIITVVWLMAELIKNPQILLELRREIEMHAVEGGVLKESLLSKCSYLQACIKETLRVHVPTPIGLPRRATKSCLVSNYMIPKDSIVVVNFWAIQLDPNVWDDASTFKPRRFLDSGINYTGSHSEFIPFSSGNRMCPGWNMAVHGMQLVVASLVYYFDWSLPKGENPSDLDMSDKFGTVLKMEKPLYLIPKLREHVLDFEICII